MKYRRVKFIPLNPIEEEQDQVPEEPEEEKEWIDGFFEYWGIQTHIRKMEFNSYEMPVYITVIIGLTRDREGNVFACDPENIKFMND